jgi:hypothetical protein
MITRLRHAWPLVALVLAAAGAVVGCNHAASDADAQGSEPVAEAAQAADAPAETGGFHGMLGKGLDTINLRADQKAAVEKIRATLRAQGEPVRAARRGFVAALADRVAAGNVDEAGLAGPIAGISRAAEAFEPAFQGSLASLHAALDPAQRQALVAELRAHRGRWHGKPGGKGHRHGMRRRLERLAAQLSLAADQVATIRANLQAEGPRDGAERPQEERGERMRAVADAFPGNTFDPATLGAGKELPEQATGRARHEVKFYAAVVPALNAAQRAKLAESVRAGHGAEQGAAEEE